MKILVNEQHGGFGISSELLEYFLENKIWTEKEIKDYDIHEKNLHGKKKYFMLGIPRFDANLIQYVETHQPNEYNGKYAKLVVKEIPDDYWECEAFQVREYDGLEWIELNHEKKKLNDIKNVLNSNYDFEMKMNIIKNVVFSSFL